MEKRETAGIIPSTLGQVALTYLITSMFTTPRNTTIDGFKNTFNLFSFLPPSATKAYSDYVFAFNTNTADGVLEQSDHHASAIKHTLFINWRQEKLGDMLETIGNIFIFSDALLNLTFTMKALTLSSSVVPLT